MDSNQRYNQWCTITGALIIVLMMLHIPLWGPFYAEDALAPVVLCLLLMGGRFRDYLKGSGIWLALFLVLAFVASVVHCCIDGWSNGYNFCVLLYLAGLFCFFRQITLPCRLRLALGGGFLAAATAAWLFGALFPSALSMVTKGFWLLTENASGSAMSFLTRRFQFTFDNPNSLGSFYVLPMAMVVTALLQRFSAKDGKTPTNVALWIALLGIALLPLCHTFSKHAVLTGAVLLAFVCGIVPMAWRPRLRHAWLVVIVIGLVCEVTVLWSTFPLSSKPPFINTVPGGYTIHQKAYWRMAVESPATFLFGRTMTAIRDAYPACAERERAREILRQYNAEHLLDGFCRFMDPHNEYLNLLTFYGAGAVVLAAVFFWCYARELHCPLALYVLLALAFCCLWDDLLSKRWIWLTLASIGNYRFKEKNT